jgi:hypothetical protein
VWLERKIQKRSQARLVNFERKWGTEDRGTSPYSSPQTEPQAQLENAACGSFTSEPVNGAPQKEPQTEASFAGVRGCQPPPPIRRAPLENAALAALSHQSP